MNRREPEIDGINKEISSGRSFLFKWIGLTIIAWNAGLLLGFLLAGVFTELLAIVLVKPDESITGNIVLGFILGATLGWSQRFVLRKQIALPIWWLLAPGVVLAGGYALLESALLLILGSDLPPPAPLWSILQTILYTLAGAMSAFLQTRYWPKGWSWIAANAVGWGGAITIMQYSTMIHGSGIREFLIFISALILGGLLLGTASGLALYKETVHDQ